jgi:hypothetical protein
MVLIRLDQCPNLVPVKHEALLLVGFRPGYTQELLLLGIIEQS